MKIFNSTEYIENPKLDDLKLEVNSMWDLTSRTVCFQDIDKTFGGGKITIAYNLKKCTKVEDSFVVGSNPPKPCKSTRWEIVEITPEIAIALKDKGYTLAKEFDKSELDQPINNDKTNGL